MMQPRLSPEGVCRAETVDSAENRVPFPQTKHPCCHQAPDTSAPMDIDRTAQGGKLAVATIAMRMANLETLPETSDATDSLNQLTKPTQKPVAKAVAASIDAREIGKKAKEPKEVFLDRSTVKNPRPVRPTGSQS